MENLCESSAGMVLPVIPTLGTQWQGAPRHVGYLEERIGEFSVQREICLIT